MDPTKVVAHDVLPQRVEVVALLAEHVRVGHRAVGIAVAATARRGDAVDAGIDGQVQDGRGFRLLAGQTERVADLETERADGDDAPAGGGQPVGGAGRLARSQRGEVEEGAAGAADGISQSQHRRAPAAEVGGAQLDTGGVAGVHPGGRQAAGDPQPRPGAART